MTTKTIATILANNLLARITDENIPKAMLNAIKKAAHNHDRAFDVMMRALYDYFNNPNETNWDWDIEPLAPTLKHRVTRHEKFGSLILDSKKIKLVSILNKDELATGKPLNANFGRFLMRTQPLCTESAEVGIGMKFLSQPLHSRDYSRIMLPVS